MRSTLTSLAIVHVLFAATAPAQDYKVERLAEAPPANLADPIKATLGESGFRVLDGDGKPFVDLWVRKAAPATAKPSGPSGALQFPVLAEGELLGAVRYAAEGHDYRDQFLPVGVYTLRYGIQPENGDHLGVSPFRDFALVIAAAKDTTADDLAPAKLEARSSEAAGSTHPGVLLMLAPPAEASEMPVMIHDEVNATWGVVLPLTVQPAGEPGPIPLPFQLVVSGVAL